MQKSITINSTDVINNKLMVEANVSIKGLIPGEQMLADSDHFSFIYLLEKANEYTYLVLPEAIWPALKEVIKQNLPVIITFNEDQLELTNFKEELEYLISNIKGNGNYGEEMVEKVETLFISDL
ncbi:hypothetical protein [Neobacillus sp. PS3-40]|uniref:UPF0738 family protein n=1 Tax=Neobacillus sp. PS3-40 TaxID=3070679 RepID=UPI0027E1E22B|nr:hypothetical protein [Neobacillus sp. PS3-40]WML43395.1 hypothetical protein RCG20_16570 [Neobacillus sp. PS3-40]